jgi:membrane-bound metal-dependent hydrolase YbcI (DUF457 family)
VDIFTHAILPMALLTLLRRRRAEVLAAGLGGAMPDMDVLVTWVTGLGDPFYIFTHRGWTHTLWGAPLVGMAGLYLFSRPWWARRWGRMGAFQWDRDTALAASFGGFLHLFLDALTISGVPLLWPLDLGRVSAQFYFYSAIYLTPFSALLIWWLYKGRLDHRRLMRGAALLVAAIVLAGGVRAATYPWDTPAGAVVQPTPVEVRWVVAVPVEQGWAVEDRAWMGQEQRTLVRGNATPAAAEAVRAAQGLGTYVGWRWTHPTPVVNTTAIEGGWRLEFRDAIALHRNATGGFLAGAFREPSALVVDVVGGQANVVARPGYFGVGG